MNWRIAAVVLACLVPSLVTAAEGPRRPYMVLTRAEADRIRKLVETEAWVPYWAVAAPLAALPCASVAAARRRRRRSRGGLCPAGCL